MGKRREAMDELGLKIYSGDYQYIAEPKIVPDGYKGNTAACPRIDAIVIPVGAANAEKVESYRKALESGKRRPVYKIGREDLESADQVRVYDYASIGAARLDVKHIQHAEKAIVLVSRFYNIERNRVRAFVVTGNGKDADFWVKSYLDDLADDGFNITITASLQ